MLKQEKNWKTTEADLITKILNPCS